MSKKHLPKSKAKTAYGLLSEIRKLILEEPKRYDQWGWIQRRVSGAMAPACGTIGCVGGWTEVLRPGNNATDILGLTFSQGDELFVADAAGKRGHVFRWEAPTNKQLIAHAERGAAHIARFQKKYAAQLKAKKV